MRTTILAVLCALLSTGALAQDADKIYQQQCAACHGAERLGGMGPADRKRHV